MIGKFHIIVIMEIPQARIHYLLDEVGGQFGLLRKNLRPGIWLALLGCAGTSAVCLSTDYNTLMNAECRVHTTPIWTTH